MSKSLGNTITVRQLLDEGVEPAALRHQLMSAQYRRELTSTREGPRRLGGRDPALAGLRCSLG